MTLGVECHSSEASKARSRRRVNIFSSFRLLGLRVQVFFHFYRHTPWLGSGASRCVRLRGLFDVECGNTYTVQLGPLLKRHRVDIEFGRRLVRLVRVILVGPVIAVSPYRRVADNAYRAHVPYFHRSAVLLVGSLSTNVFR